ncbi:MAG: phospholipase [Chloroflexi bacterium]|nr:phospholipase [Chloroflexota bacterium]
MDRSEQTIDLAIYELDLDSVVDSLARAAHRGVRVRMVIESDLVGSPKPRIKAELEQLRSAGIVMVADRPDHTMHDKFLVADGRWVETGSWNYTFSETYRNNNDVIVIDSRELAMNYTAEFEKMFVQRQFGGAKATGIPFPSLVLAGARVENYFAPEDRPANRVIAWIGTARQTIHFLAFAFTHDAIGDAMLERFHSGVEVGGVFEAADARNRFSEYARLKVAGTNVLLDGNPWNLHHKVIVIDGHVTVFGSFNFSNNADRANDENLLIIDDRGLAAAFEGEYQRLRSEAQRT